MRKEEFPNYIEPGYIPNPRQLSEEEYALVLDNVVITCVDIALTHNGKLLLGKRSRPPAPDWWIIGGRMRPGESFQDAAARNLRRESGLDIGKNRIKDLMACATAWATRAQSPASNGSHTTVFVFAAEISEEESASIKPNDEYEKLAWVNLEEAMNGPYHPYVREVAKRLIFNA